MHLEFWYIVIKHLLVIWKPFSVENFDIRSLWWLIVLIILYNKGSWCCNISIFPWLFSPWFCNFILVCHYRNYEIMRYSFWYFSVEVVITVNYSNIFLHQTSIYSQDNEIIRAFMLQLVLSTSLLISFLALKTIDFLWMSEKNYDSNS